MPVKRKRSIALPGNTIGRRRVATKTVACGGMGGRGPGCAWRRRRGICVCQLRRFITGAYLDMQQTGGTWRQKRLPVEVWVCVVESLEGVEGRGCARG